MASSSQQSSVRVSEELPGPSLEYSSSPQDQVEDFIQVSEHEYSSSRSSTVTPIFGNPTYGGRTVWQSRFDSNLDVLPRYERPDEGEKYQARKRFLDDLRNYVPAGSLVLRTHGSNSKDRALSSEEWLEATDAVEGIAYSEPDRSHIWCLLGSGWIRVFIKRLNNGNLATVRVYVLPDDVGRRYIERNPARGHFKPERNALRRLISNLDVSEKTWHGKSYMEDSGTWKTRPIMDYLTVPEGEGSLIQLFNTLQSPDPSSRKIDCPFSSAAVTSILETPLSLTGLRTELYPYQKRSAAVMIQREVQPAHMLDPRLERIQGPMDNTYYFDKETGILLRDKRTYEEARGGILAESMGWGKTLICLAVILATKGHWPQVPPEFSTGRHPVRHRVGSLAEMAASAVGRAQIPWRSYFQDLASTGESHERIVTLLEENIGTYIIPSSQGLRTRRPSVAPDNQIMRLCTATIIVVPLNLFTQWQNEISTHIEEDSLKILLVQALDTPMPSENELSTCDILLISRIRFEREMKPLEINPTTAKKIRCICAPHDICNCAAAGPKYRSPLRALHFLRIIVDEGHDFASSGGANNSIWALQRLHVDRRWIVSGTPSAGLIGTDIGLPANEDLSVADNGLILPVSTTPENGFSYVREHWGKMRDMVAENKASLQDQEYKDLEKLGRIVRDFLGLRPWANTRSEDPASWQQYVLPDKVGKKNVKVDAEVRPSGKGARKARSLRSILEGLIIRHRIEDIEKDIKLPPLHCKDVYLKPSCHDKLNINLFLLLLTANAVTSERCDEDYMFNPANRQQLNILITNLRHSGFYWTGIKPQEISQTLEVSQKYLDQPPDTLKRYGRRKAGDADLLRRAMKMGLTALESPSWYAFSVLQELGLYVEHFPAAACSSWSLLQSGYSEPLLVGASQLEKAQAFIDSQLHSITPEHGFAERGRSVMQRSWREAQINDKNDSEAGNPKKRQPKKCTKTGRSTSLGEERKLSKNHTLSKARNYAGPRTIRKSVEIVGNGAPDESPQSIEVAMKPPSKVFSQGTSENLLPPGSPLGNARLCGTASAKLSYLLDKIMQVQPTEKSLIFYEGDHIAYYIAQAFDLLDIRFLIYTGSLPVSRKNTYIHTFNTSETFRVMLMDIKQAAHGLHVASASRVFFVNPVWQPNIEAQAIKRAHRIGQRRPVFVETLVLEGTLEHQMLERRKAMTELEHIHAERGLEYDPEMADLIKDATLIPLPDEEHNDPKSQMAPLQQPQQVFGRVGSACANPNDPDADLIFPNGRNFAMVQRNRSSSAWSQVAPDYTLSPASRERQAPNIQSDGSMLSPSKEPASGYMPDAPDASPTALHSCLRGPAPMAYGPAPASLSNIKKKKVGFAMDDPALVGNPRENQAASGPSDSRGPKRQATENLRGQSKRVAIGIDETLAQAYEDQINGAEN